MVLEKQVVMESPRVATLFVCRIPQTRARQAKCGGPSPCPNDGQVAIFGVNTAYIHAGRGEKTWGIP